MTTTVTILRPPYDCTNAGVSSKHDKLLVIGAGDASPQDAAYPVTVLTQHTPGQASLRPLQGEPGRVGPMAGGNYAAGDKAFNASVEKLLGAKFYGAVAIHDRFESQELADQLGHT